MEPVTHGGGDSGIKSVLQSLKLPTLKLSFFETLFNHFPCQSKLKF